MALSTLIVQHGLATIREVEEALARQVLYGGDLVTNLLEVCAVDEAALMDVLVASTGLPAAPVGALGPLDSELVYLIAPEVARDRNLVPLAMEGGALVVAVAEPLPREAMRELSFALSLPVVARVAPYVRVRQALQQSYGVSLERRCERLLARLDGTSVSISSSLPTHHAPSEFRAPPRPPSGLPQSGGRSPSERRVQVTVAPSSFRPSMKPTGAPPPDVAEKLIAREREATPRPPKARPERRRRGPFTSEVAKKELFEATARDAIFDTVFEFTRQFFDYTALFTVHADVAEGRDAYGEGTPRESVARLGVPLDMPSVLSLARDQGMPVLKVPSTRGLDAVLMQDLGRPGETECMIVPIVVRKRVVAIVFGDGGEQGIDATALGEVTKVGHYATSAFERLLLQRKHAGLAPPAFTTPTSKDPPAKSSGRAHPSVERRLFDNPASIERAARASTAQPAERPSVEELAAPVRELMEESLGGPFAPAPSSTSLSGETRAAPSSIRASARGSIVPEPVAPELAPPGAQPAPPESVELAAAHERLSEPPPPSNLLTVRRPSGAPIPREEPGSPSVVENDARVRMGRRRAEAPAFEFTPLNGSAFEPTAAETGELEHEFLSEIQGLEPHAQGASARDADADATPLAPSVDPDRTPLAPPVALAAEARGPQPRPEPAHAIPARPEAPAVPARRAPRVMPASEQQVSVAPHRPPIPRTDETRELPSIIVDVIPEYTAFVERVLAGAGEEEENALLRGGPQAMPAIMAQFPGTVSFAADPKDLTHGGPWPRPSECGPIVRLVARQRRTALPFVLPHVDDEDENKRFWATYLLSELAYIEAIEPAVYRLFDEAPRVRRAAQVAIVALAEMHPKQTTSRLGEVATHAGAPAWQRQVAIDALGATKEPLAVPALLPILRDDDRALAERAARALVALTCQDFGESFGRWESWWHGHGEAHRVEWLIDALSHDELGHRAAAHDELARLTKETFGYADDLPKRERDRAQARYRSWWASVGRIRFHRDDARFR